MTKPIKDIPTDVARNVVKNNIICRPLSHSFNLLKYEFQNHMVEILPPTHIWFNTLLRPRQNGRHSTDDIFKHIFLNETICILMKISMKFYPKSPINNIPALVWIMAWRRPGDNSLSEPMKVSSLTHICVTRPQGVKTHHDYWKYHDYETGWLWQ